MDASLGKDNRWHWGASLSPRTEVQGYKIIDVISDFYSNYLAEKNGATEHS
jgi:hypothetical protein